MQDQVWNITKSTHNTISSRSKKGKEQREEGTILMNTFEVLKGLDTVSFQ